MKRLSLLIILLVFTVPNVLAQAYIENDYQYTGDDGMIHIVGEIINDSDKPLNQVNISATLYSDDSIIHQASTKTLTNIIMPGMKGAFDIAMDGKIPHTDSYILDLDYEIANPKKQVIEITSSELRHGLLDNIMIQGTVTNRGDATANMIKVIATFYDREGNVVAVSQVDTEPDYLRAGDEVFFLVTIPDKTQVKKIVDYSLLAESEEYTAVPEFPLGSGALLIISLSSYIILTKNPSIITRGLSHISSTKRILRRFN